MDLDEIGERLKARKQQLVTCESVWGLREANVKLPVD
jgi:hypothetical protein